MVTSCRRTRRLAPARRSCRRDTDRRAPEPRGLQPAKLDAGRDDVDLLASDVAVAAVVRGLRPRTPRRVRGVAGSGASASWSMPIASGDALPAVSRPATSLERNVRGDARGPQIFQHVEFAARPAVVAGCRRTSAVAVLLAACRPRAQSAGLVERRESTLRRPRRAAQGHVAAGGMSMVLLAAPALVH